MWTWFGSWLAKEGEKLVSFVTAVERLWPGRQQDDASPGAELYNGGLDEACTFLSRVLERMFLARWDCRDLPFYREAEHFTEMAR
jgi:hypothetical protein